MSIVSLNKCNENTTHNYIEPWYRIFHAVEEELSCLLLLGLMLPLFANFTSAPMFCFASCTDLVLNIGRFLHGVEETKLDKAADFCWPPHCLAVHNLTSLSTSFLVRYCAFRRSKLHVIFEYDECRLN